MGNWYINPVLLQIGPLTLHWYGFMYAVAFMLGYVWINYSKWGKKLPITSEQKDTLLLSVIAGVLLGGRLGYIIFYNLSYYFANPLKIFAVWEGGMSLHGGVIGVGVALLWFSRKYKVALLEIADIITSIAPLGLLFGRIGNFINGELYGRVAQKFCLYFPADPLNCRYPSQLFQSFSEGLLLFIVLAIVRKYTDKKGIVTAFFLIFYGIFRSIVEFFREPDVQVGYLWGGITEGQILSVIMILCGIVLLLVLRNYQKKNEVILQK